MTTKSQWTSTEPDTPGWYWRCVEGLDRVWIEWYDKDTQYLHATDGIFHGKGYWFGPIEEPLPPERSEP